MNRNTTDARTIVHDAGQDRYLIFEGEELGGLARYADRDSRRIFLHTEVLPAFQGHGLARDLVARALDDVRAADMRFVALCPFVARFVRERPGVYDDIMDLPEQIDLGSGE